MKLSQYVVAIGDSSSIALFLSSPERTQEFYELLQRALNTWEVAPAWALKLSDLIDPKNFEKQAKTP